MSRLLFAAAYLLFTVSTTVNAVEQGDQAPAFQGTDLHGQQISYPSAAGGRASVLVFWATWCPYCQALMPYLDAIQKEHAERGVTVVAINAKEDGDPLAYMRSGGYSLTTVADGDSIAETYGVQYIPGLFVVDGAGQVVYRRAWTDLPAGKEVAELWDQQVRSALDAAL
ncbi:MAG: TlpA family protein disulfide reductase [Gammaproteobacteria bacterium]|nr:TlpA family protein disulfide reductase [Gammaproteobacteria bacterium]